MSSEISSNTTIQICHNVFVQRPHTSYQKFRVGQYRKKFQYKSEINVFVGSDIVLQVFYLVLLIALYLGGVNDAFLYHVDVLPLHGVVTHVRGSLQDLLDNERALDTRVLGDGDGGDAKCSSDDVDACLTPS